MDKKNLERGIMQLQFRMDKLVDYVCPKWRKKGLCRICLKNLAVTIQDLCPPCARKCHAKLDVENEGTDAEPDAKTECETKHPGEIDCERCGTRHLVGWPCQIYTERSEQKYDPSADGMRRAAEAEGISSVKIGTETTHTDKIWLDSIKTVNDVFKDEQSKKVINALLAEVESRQPLRKASDETDRIMNELKEVIIARDDLKQEGE